MLAGALARPEAPAAGSHLLAAVSGGADSTALAAALAELAGGHGLRLTIGHVDHGLRGVEGARDRELVAALARRLDLACVTRTLAVAPGSNLEARARRARYRALREIAAEVQAACVATAHTQDDQAETILLRLLRGAGRRGLGGMRVRRGPIWRPLLGASRADVRHYVALRALPVTVDRTNAELRFARNRVRRIVLPLLAAEFNPQVVPHLAALAARLQDEDDLLATLAAGRAAALLREGSLDLAVAAEPPAIARRVVREWLGGAGGRLPDAAHVDRVLALAAGARRGAVAVPGPGRVLREGGRLVRRAGRGPVRCSVALDIAPGESVSHPAGAWTLTLSLPADRTEGVLDGAGASRAVFDAGALPPRLTVRSPAPGDRVHVAGVGTRKVQDVLVDARVPREARPAVPLVLAGDRVVWVAGVVRGSAAMVTPQTRQVITASLVHRALPHK